MNEKTMVSDALVGVNGELKTFGDIIPQTENKELKQCLKQMRSQCEMSQEKLYQAVLATIQAQIQLAVSMDEVLQELRRNNVKAKKSSRLETMLDMKKQEHARSPNSKLTFILIGSPGSFPNPSILP